MLQYICDNCGIKECENDLLKCMFGRQIEYQKLMGNGSMPRLDGELVEHFSMGVVTELGEVLQTYKGWKPWTNSDNYTYDKKATEEELADLWKFVVNLTLALGYESEEIHEFFMNKHYKLISEREHKGCEKEENNDSDSRRIK